MKIDFENLGNIEKGSIELNDFTLFCGKNNSGKTYAMYSIYSLLNPKFNVNFHFVKPIVKKLEKDGSYSLDLAEFITKYEEEMIDHIETQFKHYLPRLFGVPDSNFSSTKIRWNFSKEKILERIKNKKSFKFSYVDDWYDVSSQVTNGKIQFILNKKNEIKNSRSQFYIPEIKHSLETHISELLLYATFCDWFKFEMNKHLLLLPAERAGVNLLLKELFSVRNLAIQQAQNDNVNSMKLLSYVLQARYAEPLKDYMQYINSIGSYPQEESSFCEYAKTIQQNVLGGEYEVDESNNILFIPSDSKNKLPLHFSSSTVKTLFGLVFYLKHQAKKGDYLMIDEPELNLHPDNQRKVARVLAQLVNAGLKVIVSTHSDYFVRELNNLIMLKKDFAEAKALQEKYGYADNELLDDKQVSAYLFDDKKITPMTSNENGSIIAKTFNEVINSMNKSSNEIYYALQDAKELENW